jgi:hypothetical protein
MLPIITSMRMHYVPRLLLRQFVDDGGLFELDVRTRECERRNIDKAGQIRHLYNVEGETGILKRMDADAANILHLYVYGRNRVDLSVEHKRILAEWLSTLAHRNPKQLTAAKEVLSRLLVDPEAVLDPTLDYAAEYIDAVKREAPDLWAEVVADVGGEEAARAAVAADVHEQIRTRQFKGQTSAKDILSRSINQQRSENWAEMLLEFNWIWLHSQHDLIIGDDPLCTWSRRLKHIEYGLAHDDCEVTIPLARDLCLLMQREDVLDPGAVVECDYVNRCKYNNRQLLSATRKVYGPSRQIVQEAQRLHEIAAGRCPLPKGG